MSNYEPVRIIDRGETSQNVLGPKQEGREISLSRIVRHRESETEMARTRRLCNELEEMQNENRKV